jgi:hypothetical protein
VRLAAKFGLVATVFVLAERLGLAPLGPFQVTVRPRRRPLVGLMESSGDVGAMIVGVRLWRPETARLGRPYADALGED